MTSVPLRLLAPANACKSLSQYVTRTRMVPCRVTSYYMWHEGSLVRRTLCALPALHLDRHPRGHGCCQCQQQSLSHRQLHGAWVGACMPARGAPSAHRACHAPGQSASITMMHLQGATLQCYGLSACILRKVYKMATSCARDGAQALSPTLFADHCCLYCRLS